ncbi:MAG: TonB-dependent receptor [Pseudomonadota bacterium]
MNKRFKWHALAMSIACALCGTKTFAQDQNESDDEYDETEKIVVVGSRSAPRSITESPVPVDVITGEEFENNASSDLNSILSSVVPSYNVNTQPISDAATLVRPANLRGLPPDNTLVLVNGKRRHRSAIITFLGGGLSDGSHGPDVGVFPAMALRQVEVLRDGAAAQYGSDAIAGVINFELKNDNSGGTIEARYGQYSDDSISSEVTGDGASTRFSGNAGMPLTENGFLNFTYEYKSSDPTDRSVQRGDATDLIESGNAFVSTPAQIWGQPEIKEDFSLWLNSGLELNADQEIYLFGNVAERTVDGGFYYRNPNTRSGVFGITDSEAIKAELGEDYPKLEEVTSLLLVGDLTDDKSGNCPAIPVINNVPDETLLAQVSNDPNCFVFNELYPGGFTPRFGGTVTDVSLAAGTKGEFDYGIGYDVSAYYGQNEVEFLITNTVNASLGPDSPTSFSPGTYIQTEKYINFDLVKAFDVKAFDGELRVAGGLEAKEESFQIINGDAESFEIGQLVEQGFSVGSNGFPGFKPEDAGTFDRRSYAAYVDVETYVTPTLLLGTAVRFEDYYEDFGTTLDGKFIARWQFSDPVAFRSSVSTGFRAPTVGQANVRNVTTQFTNGQLTDQATLPPSNPIAIQKGASELQPEESTSFTAGFVGEIGDVFVTIDYFNIEVTDRIAQTDQLELTDADIQVLLDLGIQDAASFTSITYFTNDFDTTTQGVDFVLSYGVDLWGGATNFNLAANWTETSVDNFDPSIISDTRIRQIEDGLPKSRGTFTVNHAQDFWQALLRFNYYGSWYEAHLDDGSLPIEASSAITIDTEFAYDVTYNWIVKVGAQNLLNEYPDENPYALIAGAQYPTTSPFGFDGRFYYAELRYTF